ncbi:hypothetical protein WG66_013279, partial [Moniliophthora roreri]
RLHFDCRTTRKEERGGEARDGKSWEFQTLPSGGLSAVATKIEGIDSDSASTTSFFAFWGINQSCLTFPDPFDVYHLFGAILSKFSTKLPSKSSSKIGLLVPIVEHDISTPMPSR